MLVQLLNLFLEVVSSVPQYAVQSLDLCVQSTVLSLVFRMVLLHSFLQLGYLVQSLTQFLLRLLQLPRELGGVDVPIGGCLAQSLELRLELLYPAIALGYVFVLALDGQFSLSEIFLELRDLGLHGLGSSAHDVDLFRGEGEGI